MFRGAFTRKVRVVLKHMVRASSIFLSLFSTVLSLILAAEADVELIKSHRLARRASTVLRGAWKMAENLIFRIKNIEIQNPSLPHHKLSRAP